MLLPSDFIVEPRRHEEREEVFGFFMIGVTDQETL